MIPKPNDNITMTMGTKVIVDAVFSDTGLDRFLDGLKRDQGESVANEVKALVANSVEMTGISVERLDRSMQNRDVRGEYGLGDGASKSIYRTVERIGERSDDIVRFLGSRLKGSYGIGMDEGADIDPMTGSAPGAGVLRLGAYGYHGYTSASDPNYSLINRSLVTFR